jgi:hypothetical protein
MAQVKLLKIATDGVPVEFDSDNDDITLQSGQFGNVLVTGNSVTATNLNGSLAINPDGTGSIILSGQNWPQADGNPGEYLKTDGAGQLAWSTVEAIAVSNFYIADENLLAVDALYISGSGLVDKALADNNSATSRLIGFAKDAALDTEQVEVVSDGVLDGFSSLTPGSRYYLSAANAGEIVDTIPTGAGNTIVQAGYAKSATELHIQILQMGRRA